MKKFKFFNSKNIEIYEDFPLEIRERRKQILPTLKLLKEKGLKAFLRVDKLFVNGEYLSVTKAQEYIVWQPANERSVQKKSENNKKHVKINSKRGRTSPSQGSPSQKSKRTISNPNGSVNQSEINHYSYRSPDTIILPSATAPTSKDQSTSRSEMTHKINSRKLNHYQKTSTVTPITKFLAAKAIADIKHSEKPRKSEPDRNKNQK